MERRRKANAKEGEQGIKGKEHSVWAESERGSRGDGNEREEGEKVTYHVTAGDRIIGTRENTFLCIYTASSKTSQRPIP